MLVKNLTFVPLYYLGFLFKEKLKDLHEKKKIKLNTHR